MLYSGKEMKDVTGISINFRKNKYLRKVAGITLSYHSVSAAVPSWAGIPSDLYAKEHHLDTSGPS